MLISEDVHIWRDAGGDYHVEWSVARPDTEVTVEPLAAENAPAVQSRDLGESRARISGLPANRRHYFRLCDQHGNEVLSTERKLGMQGTPNFRDFGGYRNRDGRRVRWGYLFRSGQLSTLSDADLDLLASLQLDLVCDFRREEEQANDPSRLPVSRRPRVASLPIIPGSNRAAFEQADFDWGGREAMFDFMVHINHDFVAEQAPAYARMFREILELEDARFLVHCAAGKDRTGFAAAIVLLALGVPEEVVMRDYLLTSRFFDPQLEMARIQRKYGMNDLDSESIMPMLEVHEDYLARALATIVEDYGSVQAYLESALGVGPAELGELRRRYLEE